MFMDYRALLIEMMTFIGDMAALFIDYRALFSLNIGHFL